VIRPSTNKGADDGCDCECGAVDPDCSIADVDIYNCADGQTCPAGTCAGKPTGWTCTEAQFNSGGDCNCNCGIYDPDCDNAAATLVGCTGNMVCGPVEGKCVPPTWDTNSCSDGAYSDGVECDCACGAVDPDCAILPALPVVGLRRRPDPKRASVWRTAPASRRPRSTVFNRQGAKIAEGS